MSTPTAPPRSEGLSASSSATPSKNTRASSSITASNSLLDLLAGAPGRVTSPPSSSSAASQPLASVLPPPAQPATTSATPSVAPSPQQTNTMSAPPPQQQQQRDVSHLMQQFLAPSSPLLVRSPNGKSTENEDPMQQQSSSPSQPPVIHNKALQLPPSPPSSVSSVTGSKPRQQSADEAPPKESKADTLQAQDSSAAEPVQSASLAPPTATSPSAAASPSVKTPFDFVSPFDMLSKRDEPASTPKASSQPPPAAPAPTEHSNATSTNGYEAANAGIASLLQKLSASAQPKKAPQGSSVDAYPASPRDQSGAVPPPKTEEPGSQRSGSPPAAAAETASSPSPSRPTFRKLPSMPVMLDAPDKRYHASRHLATLEQDDSFDDPKSSGLSVLSPSRSSSAPSIATLDLAAKQPGGLSSLRHTKVETSGVALISSPFHFPCSVSAAGLLPASRIANLGHDVACYAMSKGKIRLIHVGTGARLLVQTPNKAAIRSIAAFQSDESNGGFLLAALVDRSKDHSDEGVVFWQVPSSFVLEGQDGSNPSLLGRITADPYKSPFVYRFTAIAWHPTKPRLAISTSDSNVVVFDVARQLLEQNEPASPSKKLRSLSESEIDPHSKETAHNEPLAGFAFSPDGSMLATISAPLEGDVSWILGFKSLDSSASAVDDMSFLIKSPLQEPMIISHLSFITGPSNGDSAVDATAIRGVLIGFRCNTILGLYDLASRSFKHVWKFQFPPQASAGDEEHFNLVQFDSRSSTLLVCNSFRSSIFAVPLDLQPLPSLSEAGKLADNESLGARLEQGLLPWSAQLSYPIHEYALQDPCTSVNVSLNKEDAKEPSRLFVAFPEGISIVRLLKIEPPAEEPNRSTATDAQEKGPQHVEKAAEPAPDAGPESLPEAPSVEPQATPSKSSKKKNKKKKAAAAAAAAANAQIDEESAVDKEDASAAPSENVETAAEASIAQPAPSLEEQQSLKEAPAFAPTLSIPAAPAAPARSPPAEPAPAAAQPPIQSAVSADDIQAALSNTVASAVHDAVSANISSGFQHSIETSLPQEVERLVTSTELKAEFTRNIAQSILPAVQRTAMEVVSRVLAPHFEDVMMQVSDRVERAIVSEITNVRKTLIAEQTASLNDTDKVVKAIQEQVNDVLLQLKDLKAPQTDKIVELKDDDAPREPTKLNGASRLVSTSADELSEAEAAPAVKARDFSATEQAAPITSHEMARNTSLEGKALAPATLPTKCRLPERVAIIGAGPVGCLAGLAFAQRGCKVDIFESRPDPRTEEAVARASQRSINLALSTRGITGLRSVSLVGLGKHASTGMDLADLVLKDSVPMRARMIHVVTRKAIDGKDAQVKEISQLYSTKGESINSVDRGRLNNILLDHALMHPNVEVHFEHKLQTVDFDHDTRSAGQQASVPVANGVSVKKSMRAANGNGTGEESSADESYRRGKGKYAGGKSRRNGQQQELSKTPSTGAGSDRVRLEFNVHSNNQRIPKSTTTHLASFVVGCDGAHSSIRSAMGSLIRMHYTHNYIDTGYVELSIPPRTSLSSGSRIRGAGGVDGKPGGHDAFHLDPNHLHIWPRHSFMLIALPNLDGSFTCTLFAPFKMFASELSTKEGILAVFKEHFPDALPLIGEDKLVECLTNRRASALGSVQCDPYHYKDRAVLIGDAAHAMLPFYGQGLNCGFEDVRVMFDVIDAHETLETALDTYTKQRHPDLVAILGLAEQNYREMAHSVVSWPYLLRKKLDGLLMSILPSSMWSSLYAMTTFSNLPYSSVVKAEQRQQRIIGNVLLMSVVGIMTGAVVGVYRTRGVWQPVTQRWIEGLQKKA